VNAEQARARLVAELMAAGSLSDDCWRAAFEQVSRHVFIPDTVWRVDKSAGAGCCRCAAAPIPMISWRWLTPMSR
jgi:hypothetical protein